MHEAGGGGGGGGGGQEGGASRDAPVPLPNAFRLGNTSRTAIQITVGNTSRTAIHIPCKV